MTHQEAMQLALGYSWASEDATGKPTASSGEGTPSYEFATAFAAAWDAFNEGRRCCMTNVADAYRCWNESGAQGLDRRIT